MAQDTEWFSLAGTFYTTGKQSGGLELCKIKLFYKAIMWLLFKNIRTLKMIPWRLFISFIFISERISKHPIPKPKEIPEDKNKNIKFMIRLKSPDWRHLLELFHLTDFTAQTISISISADKDCLIPRAELCSWVTLLMCLALPWQPNSDEHICLIN